MLKDATQLESAQCCLQDYTFMLLYFVWTFILVWILDVQFHSSVLFGNRLRRINTLFCVFLQKRLYCCSNNSCIRMMSFKHISCTAQDYANAK